MSDANKQSVVKCEYRHDWKARVEKAQIKSCYCCVCGFEPRPDSKLWHEAKSIIHLRSMIAPGDTVYTVLRHVSRSGMSRRISLFIGAGEAITNISWHAAHALGDSVKNRAGYVQDVGIEIGGCGMDMGFDLVYNLGRVLFPGGFICPGKSCRWNDHSNPPYPEREDTKHEWHNGDGGYALHQQWL